VPRKEEKNWRRYGSGQPKPAPAWHTGQCLVPQAGSAANWPLSGIGGATWLKIVGLYGGVPDCPVRLQRPRPSTSATNSSLSGKGESVAAKIHWTVRWFTGLSDESEPPEPTVISAISGQRVARANGRLGTLDSVRCANETAGPMVGCSRKGRGSSTRLLQDLSGGAPDCPVHHSIEGRICFPSWSPTAPSCLGAIKGTPRRMEQHTKHSLSILRLPDSVSTHLIDCVSDLSSVWVVNPLCCVSSSSLGLCACVCCGFESCVCYSPSLSTVLLLWQTCKGERLQYVEIPRKREKDY
jgi:hypothetical protein